MKKLLVLAGGSRRNEAWGEACAEYFRSQFDLVCFIRYEHWATGESNLDFDAEIAKIAANVEGAGEEGEWYVFAKSIGSILALKAAAADAIKPTKCVFFGMPFSVVKDSLFRDDWMPLENFKIPALAFHNDNDPTAEYGLAQEKIATLAPSIKFRTLFGDNHDYLDFGAYEANINSFLNE
ncbi:MAG: hypothetical protein RLZZ480_268 [Candidatus Parcubacteria bacterium]|jgi:alpha-beta hydrolase superfamily lysophospholipase